MFMLPHAILNHPYTCTCFQLNGKCSINPLRIIFGIRQNRSESFYTNELHPRILKSLAIWRIFSNRGENISEA